MLISVALAGENGSLREMKAQVVSCSVYELKKTIETVYKGQ